MDWNATPDRIDFLQARRLLLLGDQERTSEPEYAAYDAALQADGHEVARYNPTLDPFLGKTGLRWQLQYLTNEAQGVAVIPTATSHPHTDLLVAAGRALGLPIFDADTRRVIPSPAEAIRLALEYCRDAVQAGLDALPPEAAA